MAETRSRARAGKPRVFKIGPQTPDEVTRAARSRGVELAPVYYGTRQAQARALAFTVSGLASLEQLATVKRSLDEAIARGDSFTAWRKAVLRGEVPLTLPDHRLELIWRNNLQTAYARGNGAWQKDHADSHPFLLYDAVNDTRTRPAHARMDGTIKPVGDSWWGSHYPPNGHNCRCRVIALTEEMAQEMGGVTIAPPADGQPDPGWEYDPRVDPTAAIRKVARNAQGKLPRQLANRVADAVAPMADGPNLGRSPVRTVEDALRLGREELDSVVKALGITRQELTGRWAREAGNIAWLRATIRKQLLTAKAIGGVKRADVDFIRPKGGMSRHAAAVTTTQTVVEEYVPRSWIAAARASSRGPLRVQSTTGRAHYAGFDADGPLMLSPAGGTARAVSLHEFSHWLQHHLPDLDELFQAYTRRRVAGSPLTRLRQFGPGYRSNELTRPDQLWNPYAGKFYDRANETWLHAHRRVRERAPTGYLEMMPMLMQSLADTITMQAMLDKGDVEALEFLLGIVRWWRP